MGSHPGLGAHRHRVLSRGGDGGAPDHHVAAADGDDLSTTPPEATDSPRTPVIDVGSVGKTFASQAGTTEALREVTLSIASGEFVSIIGPSGCGKSTLLRIIG